MAADPITTTHTEGQKACQYCGVHFMPRRKNPKRWARTKYCSVGCKNRGLRKVVTTERQKKCQVCGVVYVRGALRPVSDKSWEASRFCSNNCRSTSERKYISVSQFFAETIRRGECLEWTGWTNKRGYGRLYWTVANERKPILAHRVAWQIHTGEEPPDDMMVCHHCDNPTCVLIDHLYLGTAADNMRDRVERGARGGDVTGRAKLTDVQVLEIREKLMASGARYGSARELAIEYGVSDSIISRIKIRQTYSHI